MVGELIVFRGIHMGELIKIQLLLEARIAHMMAMILALVYDRFICRVTEFIGQRLGPFVGSSGRHKRLANSGWHKVVYHIVILIFNPLVNN